MLQSILRQCCTSFLTYFANAIIKSLFRNYFCTKQFQGCLVIHMFTSTVSSLLTNILIFINIIVTLNPFPDHLSELITELMFSSFLYDNVSLMSVHLLIEISKIKMLKNSNSKLIHVL